MTRRDLYCRALGLPVWPDPAADLWAWCQRTFDFVDIPNDLVVTHTEHLPNGILVHYGKRDDQA